MPDPEAISPSAFRPLIVRAIVFPIVVAVILVGVLVWQLSRLIAAAEWVQHTDEAISRLYAVEKMHVDLDAGLRAFLLSRDRGTLGPFETARSRVEPALASLIDFVKDNPSQVVRLEATRATRDQWLAYADERIAHPPAGTGLGDPALYAPGRVLLEKLRADFSTMIASEEALRAQRTTTTRRSAYTTVAAASASALIFGSILAIFSRRQLDVLAREYEAALRTAREFTTTLEARIAERTDELRVTNGRLQDANHELEAFSYSVSHDLRAPMRHISGFADLLRRGLGDKLDADSAENLQTIRDTAKQAGTMVDDLLNFSRMGRTEMRETNVDVAALVSQVRAEQSLDIVGRAIEWKIGHLPCVQADPALLKLVYQNLISNALKYSRVREQAVIEIGAREAEGGAEFFVKDNGVGFDMRYVDKLFGVFQRLHRAEEFEGTGIGLANVRRIITRHGGTVRAEAVPEEGATFIFTLGRIQK